MPWAPVFHLFFTGGGLRVRPGKGPHGNPRADGAGHGEDGPRQHTRIAEYHDHRRKVLPFTGSRRGAC